MRCLLISMDQAEYQMLYDQAAANQVATSPEMSPAFFIVVLVIAIYSLVVMWRVFVKAGQAGWKSIIPIYNIYILLKIVNRPGWWLILYFIPFVNIVISIIVMLDLGKAFGKSVMWSIFLLILFQIIGMSILAFAKVSYKKPVRMASPAAPASPSSPTPPPSGTPAA
jgi:hypothetical protein